MLTGFFFLRARGTEDHDWFDGYLETFIRPVHRSADDPAAVRVPSPDSLF